MKKFFSNIQYPISNIVLIFLLLLGLFYRLYGLTDNHAFWTDEEHVAIFARAILERGKPVLSNGYSTGIYQWLQYWLSAISARVLGLNEFAIRFPSVIFGVLSIWAIYLLGKELFNKNAGLVAALFTTFLKIEILWSRQARPYQALQFFYLLGAYFICKLTKEKKFNWHYFLGFLSCGILASLMHGLGLVIFFIGFLYLLLTHFTWFKKWMIILGGLLGLVFIFFFRTQIFSALLNAGNINNLFYYRVFLWHNYSLLVFLALIGFLSQIFQKKDSWKIIILFLIVQTIIVSFFLGKPFVRYFYIVSPFLVLFSAAGLVAVSKVFTKKHQFWLLALLLFFLIAMGNKFTLIPRRVYSLNEDMQEIPEVDYKKIYFFIKKELDENPDAVYVSNWNDHPVWYLGEGELDYLLRKSDFSWEEDPFSGATYLETTEELKSVIEKEDKGLILLESWESELPQGTADYIRQNLNKEFEVDRLYPTQPRYWPVEVYSWGI